MINILLVGKDNGALETISNLITNQPSWYAAQTKSDEEAIEKFHQQHFDAVILTAGLSDETDKKLTKIFTLQDPDIIIIRQHGDETHTIIAELSTELEARREQYKPTISVTDDALKNARWNIDIQ